MAALAKVQLALSLRLDKFEKLLKEKAMAGNMGAVKALSMFLPLRPMLVRFMRELKEQDAETLINEIRVFLQDIDA